MGVHRSTYINMDEANSELGVVTVDGKKLDSDSSGQDIVTVTDRSGHTLKFQLFQGVHYIPLFKVAILQQIKGLKMRPDDIYFSGYPRTGTNWTFEMTSMLLNGKAETIQRAKDLMELSQPDKLAQLPSPRIVNSHMKLCDSPDDVAALKCKVIYTLRDPKDVIVSLYNLLYDRPWSYGRYQGSLEDYLHLFLDGTVEVNGIFEHWRDAEKYFSQHPEIPVHLQSYEDAIKDPVRAVQTLSDFLGLPRDDDLCRAIAEKCNFSGMKIDKEPFTVKIDGESCLYRKGIVGDWKNWFNDQMLEDYYRVYEEKMAGSRFYETYARS
ncbi:sulfotransferase 1B1-like isoform X2 [Haliotis rufescens]|uniref:sulfotransferase 1B1-like isoform X2 n=1 Tax=Haliotis rufescens TaxID=6454 RepID=UPI00201F7DAA|nr:sulfotransferase 1B1-like isoform X2 [Haliotis rufescens]